MAPRRNLPVAGVFDDCRCIRRYVTLFAFLSIQLLGPSDALSIQIRPPTRRTETPSVASFRQFSHDCRRLVRPSVCLCLSSTTSSSKSSSLQEGFEWEAEDVYQDLDRLEQAINLSNAQQNLAHEERIEMMDTFAQQRRPITPDLRHFILAPFGLSLAFAALRKSPLSRLPATARMDLALDVHFWSLVVIAPLLFFLLQLRRSRTTDSDDVPSELQGLDPAYYRFLTTSDWENPKTSCRDYVKCLVEQWTSAVVGMALTGLILPASWRLQVQILTRIAAVAAVHQYPKLLFQLMRKQQPLPLAGRVWAMQLLLGWQVMPWAVALDLSRLLGNCRWLTLGTMTGGLAAGLVAASQLYRLPPTWTRERWSRSSLKLLALAALVCYGQLHLQSLQRIWAFAQGTRIQVADFAVIPFLQSHAKSIRNGFAVVASLVGPLCHVLAVRKIVRVMHTHDLSLALDTEQFQEKMENPDEQKRRYQWRYRLAWREPKRIRTTLKELRKGFWYWFFFTGGVQDKLRRDFVSNRKSQAEQRGLTVLQRIAEDRKKNPDAPVPDRTMWKQQAMDRLARKHQKDYDRKKFEDPLGVAVHQTFGIGLGFNFDHMSTMEESELPSTRRLQARAAKSAIRRAQEIYDAASARGALDAIEDPKERKRLAFQMRLDAENEIKYLATKLSELIPTDLSLDDGRHTRIQQYAPTDFTRTSSKEYNIRSKRDQSDAIKSLTDAIKEESPGDEIDYLNPSGKDRDDGFEEEWLKLNQYGSSDDDEDPDTKTVLA